MMAMWKCNLCLMVNVCLREGKTHIKLAKRTFFHFTQIYYSKKWQQQQERENKMKSFSCTCNSFCADGYSLKMIVLNAMQYCWSRDETHWGTHSQLISICEKVI